jgi:hypothetical protein
MFINLYEKKVINCNLFLLVIAIILLLPLHAFSGTSKICEQFRNKTDKDLLKMECPSGICDNKKPGAITEEVMKGECMAPTNTDFSKGMGIKNPKQPLPPNVMSSLDRLKPTTTEKGVPKIAVDPKIANSPKNDYLKNLFNADGTSKPPELTKDPSLNKPVLLLMAQ